MAMLKIPENSIRSYCISNNIKLLALFGSVLRETFSQDSDVDMLVEFLPGERVGMIKMARIERELSQLMGGRKVDLRTPAELSRYFRDEVLKTVEICYEN